MLLATRTPRARLWEAKNARPAQPRADAPLHCGFLVEARDLVHARPQGMVRVLTAGGHRVTVFDSQSALLDIENSPWLAGLDLLIARGRSTDLLARLRVAEAARVPTLNRRQAIAAVVDKAHMATQLRAAGIPAPQTWIGAIAQIRREIPLAAYPLILKPTHSDNSRGLRIVETPRALDDAAGSEPCVIAQRLLATDGFGVKLYAIGDRVWAMRKRSALHGDASTVTRLRLPLAWRDLALRCGELFGLQLFGVDCIETNGALQVIEVNDFPDYTGVPGADFLLAAHVAQYAYARRRA